MKELLEKIDGFFVEGAINGLSAILFYSLFYLLINKLLNRYIKKQNWKHKYVIIKVKSIVIYTLYGFALVSQFTFSKDLGSTLLASGGIVAVVVGLASQEAASNLVSGMMILFAKPFNIGDTIILKDQGLRGEVKDITMNHTVIETLDSNLITIPNTIMNKSIVENLTSDTEVKTAYLYVDVAYETDLRKAIQVMQTVIEQHPLFLDTSSNQQVKVPVHCMDFKDSGISLRAKITTRSVGDGFQLCSDCRLLIKEAFDQEGIEIPYPHIHIVKDSN